MRCDKCKSSDTKVIDTRPGKDENSIKRRRQCLSCAYRFTTLEQVLRDEFIVLKRDGRKEEFSPEKLASGLEKALQKKASETPAIREMLQAVITFLENKYDSEVTSQAIGEVVMERLVELDQVAYVRFASVYKDFHHLDEFKNEIKLLLTKPKKELKPVQNLQN